MFHCSFVATEYVLQSLFDVGLDVCGTIFNALDKLYVTRILTVFEALLISGQPSGGCCRCLARLRQSLQNVKRKEWKSRNWGDYL